MTTPFPPCFQDLIRMQCLPSTHVATSGDGFFAVVRSLSDILQSRGITTFQNDQGQQRFCDRFFDDWFLYALPQGDGFLYSLYKMREQESDALESDPADGDIPGVTVCFIAFSAEILLSCLEDPSPSRRTQLNREINRVVAARGQSHHPALKDYFRRPEAKGPYLMARLYAARIASFSREGRLPVPQHYRQMYQQSLSRPGRKYSRIPDFLEANNRRAGYPVCDHQFLYIRNPAQPSPWETLAILATHTANTSFHSFAAEIRYHACFLFPLAKLPLPGLGHSLYASAIRADLSIHDTEREGTAPYHNPNSRWIRTQQRLHPEYDL